MVVAAVVMDTSNTGGAAAAITPDPTMEQIVTDMVGASHLSMSRVIGTLGSDLDCRFCNVRTKETTAGNFVCDIVLNTLHVDVCLINSGSFRSDMVHPAGDFTLGDLVKARPLSETRDVPFPKRGTGCMARIVGQPARCFGTVGWRAPQACCVCFYTGRQMFPFASAPLRVSVTGELLLKALENSVCHYPVHEGRFCQVSGVKFVFDPSLPPHHRSALCTRVSYPHRLARVWCPPSSSAHVSPPHGCDGCFATACRCLSRQGAGGLGVCSRRPPGPRSAVQGRDHELHAEGQGGLHHVRARP